MFLLHLREFPSLLPGREKHNDISRLQVDEIARVPNMLPSKVPLWSG
jgi:hypothetical protein